MAGFVRLVLVFYPDLHYTNERGFGGVKHLHQLITNYPE